MGQIVKIAGIVSVYVFTGICMNQVKMYQQEQEIALLNKVLNAKEVSFDDLVKLTMAQLGQIVTTPRRKA